MKNDVKPPKIPPKALTGHITNLKITRSQVEVREGRNSFYLQEIVQELAASPRQRNCSDSEDFSLLIFTLSSEAKKLLYTGPVSSLVEATSHTAHKLGEINWPPIIYLKEMRRRDEG